MTTLLNKVFGVFDLNQNIKTQLDSKEEEDFLKTPVRSLEGNEKVSATIDANTAADASLTTSDTIQVNNEIEFNKVITDHIADYDVEREYETLVKLGQLHNTINKALAAKGHVQNTQDYAATLDILSEDLYSTENNSSNSLWGAIAKEHSLPNIRTVTAAVSPDIYHTLAGEKNAKFGGMSDANMYPEEMFARWTKSGNIYEFPKQTGGHVTRELMYGKEVGSKVHAGMKNAYIRHNKIISGKYGGILSGSLYAFFAIGIVLGRWEFVNWREEQRQRLKYALRIVDPEAPVTQSQKDIAEVHKKWLQTYYEEEEEEEEEEEDDE